MKVLKVAVKKFYFYSIHQKKKFRCFLDKQMYGYQKYYIYVKHFYKSFMSLFHSLFLHHHVITISKEYYLIMDLEDFDQQLEEAGSKLVVVDFYATWCGPCKTIAPKIEALSKELENVVFLKVDVDDCEELSQRYKISCMPTFLFFRNKEKGYLQHYF
ncbi:Thioredoxin-2 [Armadillidium vulgare]|nr:Thioredoxin-2 [Armadillidium vulgare]